MRRIVFTLCFSFLLLVVSGCQILSAGKGSDKVKTAQSNKENIKPPSVVYMVKEISPESLLKIHRALGMRYEGKTGIKISTGEPGSNYLRPELIGLLVKSIPGASLVECNTAYGRFRQDTASHRRVIHQHGFDAIAPVDIMDEEGQFTLPAVGGLKQNYVGSHLKRYRQFLILSHFKGHTMAGFGGAIKNVSIGMASAGGKGHIHGSNFIDAMAEATKSVHDAMDGRMAYINVMNRLSLDCDCEEDPREPEIHDKGILASVDPVALDQACVDLIFADPHGAKMKQQIERLHGLRTLERGEEIGLGHRKYTLVKLDEK